MQMKATNRAVIAAITAWGIELVALFEICSRQGENQMFKVILSVGGAVILAIAAYKAQLKIQKLENGGGAT